MKFRLDVQEGKVVDVSHLLGYIYQLDNGAYNVEIKRHRKPRSLSQNSYLWAVVYPHLLEGLLDAGWEFTDTKQVHEYFKSHFASTDVVNRHTGEVMSVPSSTADMNTLEFSVYVEKLREYGAEYLGVQIPDPDDD